MCMADDERHWGNIFMGETPVISEGPLLPAEIAAKWKRERGYWAAVIESLFST
jgi:hypothetical protein